ncbi:hypothetical protein [Vallitalea okinawensis]|nr:hypothetical protein [Vallitalea okinawensis]
MSHQKIEKASQPGNIGTGEIPQQGSQKSRKRSGIQKKKSKHKD